MTQSRNRQLAPLAVLAAALIAAGTAYAASRMNSSPSNARLSVGYAATPISSNNGGGGHGPGGGEGHRGGHGDDLAAAATYLGLTQAELTTQLPGGKTLAQVAGSTSGKTVAGLIDALVAAEKTELAAAVTAGAITQAQADQITTGLKARVTAEVNGTRPDHGRGGPDGHRGPGGDDFTAAATYLGVTVTQAQRDAMVPNLKARFTALVNGTRPAHDDHGPGFKRGTATASSTHI